jgi:hypothetical protein
LGGLDGDGGEVGGLAADILLGPVTHGVDGL